ncbi:MAG: hypothetical protein WCT51_01845 [Candidatus Shapirobacteria bacterium]|jgi:hypothetical protein
MSLEIEYNQKKYQATIKEPIIFDDPFNGVHLRAFGHKNGGYISISNAKPEGQKNGPKYCEVGFYAKTQNNNPTNFIEEFMGREKPFIIKIEATYQKPKKK